MNKSLNSFQLKIIAITLMAIDHTGALFFPEILLFRIIGRLAFPLFAFLISEGYFHTRSVEKYLMRLGTCAILFQIPDWFSSIYSKTANAPGFGVHYVFNIFATLFFGLSAIALFDNLKGKSVFLAFLAAAGMAIAAETTGADYGAYGVIFMFIFYLARGEIMIIITGGILLHVAYAGYELFKTYLQTGNPAFPHVLQLYSLLAVLLVALYNYEQGRKMKYFFYAFYPAHLIALYIIDWLIH